MNDGFRKLESQGVRLVVALLLGLGVIIGSIALIYFPWELVVWVPAVGMVMATGIAIVPWRPFGYLVLVWSGLLVLACAAGIAEFARAEAPIGVLVALTLAGFCLASGGLLEFGVLRRGRHVTFSNAD